MRRMIATAGLLVLVALAATPALATKPGPSAGEGAAAEHAVASRPVTFTVQNVNRSDLACPTDGTTYRVRGRIVGPRGGIDDATTATLYLHGLELGKFFWTQDAQGAGFAERQARDGHVSVVIDRLGYDDSGKPDGFASCLGGQADIAHQIVQKLRSGDYRARGASKGPGFDRVVLAGHSVGGLLTILAAHSFGDVDGIIVMSYSDTVQSDALRTAAAANAAACAMGGQRTEGGTFPGGYAPFAPTVADFQASFFVSADPEDIDRTTERRNLNPCGDTATFAAAGAVNLQHIGEIRVPVLVAIGAEDALFPPPAGPAQRALFTGTTDVSLVTLSPSGHAVTVDSQAPRLSDAVSGWLEKRA